MPAVDFLNRNWEWLLGGNWLARIGIVALVIGTGFFISLAIDRGWLGETERVALGIAGGLALLGAGEYWRKRYDVWAQTVTGGGLAILYLSVYGAFALYELIGPLPAFGVFSLITVAGAALALRYDAPGVAALSIFGGFATPLLLRDGLPDERLLLAYVLVMDAGVLVLASFRNWRWLTLMAWAGSLVLFGFWQWELGPTVALSQIGITAIFLMFSAATIAFNIVRQRPSNAGDLALLTLNALAYYGISYELLNDEYRSWMGAFTASLAVFYVLLAVAAHMRGTAQLNLRLFSAGLAVVFAVLAVPIQFGGPWVSVAWAVEGLVLIWLSFPTRMRELRWFGYATFGVFAIWLLAVDTPRTFGEDISFFLNWYMLSYGIAIITFGLAGWLLRKRQDELDVPEQIAYVVFAVGAAVAAAVAVPVQLDGVWVAIGWSVEAALILTLSGRLALAELRWASYGLLVAVLVRLLAWDTFGLDLDTFRPVINWRFLPFAVGIGTLYFAAIMVRGQSSRSDLRMTKAEMLAALPTLLVVANFATLWLLSAEVIASSRSTLFGLSDATSGNVANLGLSLLWAIYAVVLIVLGVARRWRWVRVAGLSLLAVPVVKLFAFDSLVLEQEYRVISFIVLGLILVASGLFYQRYSRIIRGFLFE